MSNPLKGMFTSNAFGSGIKWDTSDQAVDVNISVRIPWEIEDVIDEVLVDELLTCEPNMDDYLAKKTLNGMVGIAMTVSFMQSCTFVGTIFGKSVI